jgi:hypothetical protein
VRSRIVALAAFAFACGDENNSPTSVNQTLCHPVNTGDVELGDDAGVTAAASLTVVEGDLLVCHTEITTLSLPTLTTVAGNIVVYDNEHLTTIDLPLLESLGSQPSEVRMWRGLLLEANPVLGMVDAPALRLVADHLWLADNAALTRFDLPLLSRVEGALAVRATQISTIDGFANLRFIGGALALYDNPALSGVSGLTQLVSVSAELLLSNNAAFASMSLPALRTVGGSVGVANLDALTELELPALTTVGRNLTLVNTSLEDLGGLAAIETVAGDLALTDNDDLASASLPALEQLGGSFLVADDPALTGMAFDQLTYVGNDLEVRDNTGLATLTFASLAEIAGGLTITDNTELPTCTAEELRDAIGTDQIGGEISISGNATCP